MLFVGERARNKGGGKEATEPACMDELYPWDVCIHIHSPQSQGGTDRPLDGSAISKISCPQRCCNQSRGCCNAKTGVTPKFKLFGGNLNQVLSREGDAVILRHRPISLHKI